MYKLWKEYGFDIMFWIAVITLLFIFVSNLLSGKKGSYDDYTNMIWKLMAKPAYTPKKSSSFRYESKGERECRRVVEEYTGRPFPKTRPDFLRNEITGGVHNLELDCFNRDLMIGVEYNGEQHYKYIPYFHKSKDAFYNIKYRDDLKKRLCLENGVKLIIVPYTVKDIKTYIRSELNKMRVTQSSICI
jgi:hypothetical protein